VSASNIINGLLDARGVAFRYVGQHAPGFQAVSLKVEAGERLLITGPSGCGKSTLTRCLVGLIPHLYRGEMTGEVRLNGWRTADTALWQLAEAAGLVLQNPLAQMLTSTVENEIAFGLENLGLPAAEIGLRVDEMIARFGLERLRERDPRRLSGGEGQRVVLASTLSRRPPIIVLDEPLSMLDTTTAEELIAYLHQLADEGHAVIVCEHRSRYFDGGQPFREHRLGEKPITRLDQVEDAPPLDRAPDFRLKVRDLSVTFGSMRALDQVDFEVAGGEVVALVGANGSGKTTLLRSLMGFQHSTGSIEMSDGGPIDLGLVYQNPDLQLFNPTVREEILYRLDEPDEAFYAWLTAALGLDGYQDASPLLLSEGEKKRLCLALVLMHKPRHGVLLDEPTLGQDDGHRLLLGRTVRGMAAAGRLTLVATHDLAWALSFATRMIVLHHGKVIADGEPTTLLRESAIWQAAGLRVPGWIWEPIA
jgi:energy-coupling factor transport system ATP-binding protein